VFTLELIRGKNKKDKGTEEWGGEGYKGLGAERMKERENTGNL